MKKTIVSLLIVSILVCIGVCADDANGGFGIKINGEDYVHKLPMVIIDGKSYVQLRSFGELINCDVDWNKDEQLIEINTAKDDNKFVVIPGYEENNEGGYVLINTERSLDISEETAISIADAVLCDLTEESFFKAYCDVKVIENTDEFIEVMRYKELTAGGGAVVRIRKTDGKIMNIEFGE